MPRRDWWSLLRIAVTREPLVVARSARDLPGASGRVTEGLASMLAGDVAAARQILLPVAEDEASGPLVGVVAATGVALAELLAGLPQAVDRCRGGSRVSREPGTRVVGALGPGKPGADRLG